MILITVDLGLRSVPERLPGKTALLNDLRRPKWLKRPTEYVDIAGPCRQSASTYVSWRGLFRLVEMVRPSLAKISRAC